MDHGLSCSVACRIFPDQGLNLCLLYRQADSSPVSHQGSPQNLGGWKTGCFMLCNIIALRIRFPPSLKFVIVVAAAGLFSEFSRLTVKSVFFVACSL